jgi:hypothetical protein
MPTFLRFSLKFLCLFLDFGAGLVAADAGSHAQGDDGEKKQRCEAALFLKV